MGAAPRVNHIFYERTFRQRPATMSTGIVDCVAGRPYLEDRETPPAGVHKLAAFRVFEVRHGSDLYKLIHDNLLRHSDYIRRFRDGLDYEARAGRPTSWLARFRLKRCLRTGARTPTSFGASGAGTAHFPRFFSGAGSRGLVLAARSAIRRTGFHGRMTCG